MEAQVQLLSSVIAISTRTHTHPHTKKNTLTRTHSHTQKHTATHTHSHAHAHTGTHRHTQAHTLRVIADTLKLNEGSSAFIPFTVRPVLYVRHPTRFGFCFDKQRKNHTHTRAHTHTHAHAHKHTTIRVFDPLRSSAVTHIHTNTNGNSRTKNTFCIKGIRKDKESGKRECVPRYL